MAHDPYVLETSIVLPRPLAEVFPFFASPENLEVITPPWLNFRILTPRPIPMKAGALIDYRIRLHGLPLKWRTLISAYEPPRRFVDTQVRGPYRLWEHTHTFEEITENGRPATRVGDRVRYLPMDIPRAVPLLGGIVHRLFVRGELARIFSYREKKLRALFGAGAATQEQREPAPAGAGMSLRSPETTPA
jgi:ligand-binding SRPBCC domain-containing protein